MVPSTKCWIGFVTILLSCNHNPIHAGIPNDVPSSPPTEQNYTKNTTDIFLNKKNGSQIVAESALKFVPSHYQIELKVPTENLHPFQPGYETDSESEKSRNGSWWAPGKVKIFGKLEGSDFNNGDSENSSRTVTLHARNMKVDLQTLQVATRIVKVAILIEKLELIEDVDDKGLNLIVIHLSHHSFALDSDSDLEISLEYKAKVKSVQWEEPTPDAGIHSFIYVSAWKGNTFISTVSPDSGSYASQLFPCACSDPQLLSTFQLTLIRPANPNLSPSVSNAELLRSLPEPQDPDWIRDEFAKTSPMTADSLAFVISDFQTMELPIKLNDGSNFTKTIPMRVHSTQTYFETNFGLGAGANGSRFLNSTILNWARTLEFNVDYFNFSGAFPNGKLDIVWAPRYLSRSSPGLILASGVDTLTPLAVYKTNELVGLLALQWFSPFTEALREFPGIPRDGEGNRLPKSEPLRPLYLFLRELGLEQVWKEDEVLLALRKFCRRAEDLYLYLESQERSEICTELHLFYLNGGELSPFSMLADANEGGTLLGPEGMQKAIHAFLEELSGSAQNTGKILGMEESKSLFWKLVDEEAMVTKNKNRSELPLPLPENVTSVQKIFTSWTDQFSINEFGWCLGAKRTMVVEVAIVNQTHLGLTQHRLNGAKAENGTHLAPWYLPVSIRCQNETLARVWLQNEGELVTVPVNHTGLGSSWILLDSEGTSPTYRILYDPELTQRIQKQLDFNYLAFEPETRQNFLDDYSFFLRLKSELSGNPNGTILSQNSSLRLQLEKLEHAAVLNLTGYLDKERDPVVWLKVMELLNYFRYKVPEDVAVVAELPERYVAPPTLNLEMNEYFSSKMEPFLKSLDIAQLFQLPPHSFATHLNLLLESCKLGSKSCARNANQVWKLLSNKNSTLNYFSLAEEGPGKEDLIQLMAFGKDDDEAVNFARDFAFNVTVRRWLRSVENDRDYHSWKKDPRCPRDFARFYYWNVWISLLRNKKLDQLPELWKGKELEKYREVHPSFENCTIEFPKQGKDILQLSSPFLCAGNWNKTGSKALGSDCYREFFYGNCDWFANFTREGNETEGNPLGFFPVVNSKPQLENLNSFIQSKPACLEGIPEEEIETELESRLDAMLGFEKWKELVGNEILEWFQIEGKEKIPSLTIMTMQNVTTN